MSAIPPRSDVPEKQTWYAELVFATREDWRKELALVDAELGSLSDFPGTLSKSAKRLAEWIHVDQALSRRVEKLTFYAFMASAVDSGDAEAVAMSGQVQSLDARFAAKTAFAEPELLGMDETVLREWFSTEDSLNPYQHYVSNILRLKPHFI